ncbi:MAG: COG2958 family protein [Alphaproteobacteria bacterium]
MEEKFSLMERVAELLRSKPGEAFTARALAAWLLKSFPHECRQKMERSKNQRLKTEIDLIQQLAAEIKPRNFSKDPYIKIIEERPRRFYYSERSDEEELSLIEKDNPSGPSTTPTMEMAFSEADLYPLLAQYLAAEFDLYTKRIDEKRSSNRRGLSGNIWLYPDMVSLENLTRDWDRDLRDCVGEMMAPKARLWSFEVKKLLNRSNIREAYFQAVSNSSWAHYGYLVAGSIEGADTLKELRMLYGLHGIGIIQLNVEDIAESEVLIPARFRAEVDWSTANRLCEENSDFRQFIKLVRQFHQTGEVPETGWDGQPRRSD